MSSISKAELIAALEPYPDDAEVIFEIRERDDEGDILRSIAYINGIRHNKDFNEIYLMN